jgi:hypothetical protein
LARNDFISSAELEREFSCKKDHMPCALNCHLMREKLFRNLLDKLNIKRSIHCLHVNDKFLWTISCLSRKRQLSLFHIGFLRIKLFGPWWWLWCPLHALKFRLSVIFKHLLLVSSYDVIKKIGLPWQIWMKSRHDTSFPCFCSSVRICGAKCSVSCYGRFQESPLLRFIRHHSHSQSAITCIHFTDISVFVCISGSWWTPLLGYSWRLSRPNLNRSKHWNTLVFLKASLPQRVCNTSWLSVDAFNTNSDVQSLLHDSSYKHN